MVYTELDMLAIWLRVLGLEVAQEGAELSGRSDGIDVRAYLRRAMRSWYLDLLDHAPVEALAVTEVAPEAEGLLEPPGREAEIGRLRVPERWRRICMVQAHGWKRPVAPVPAAEADGALARLASRYTMPGPGEPLAVAAPGRLICAPMGRRTFDSLTVVADPGPEVYELHESLLATIPRAIDFTRL